MLGFGAIGEFAITDGPRDLPLEVKKSAEIASLVIQGIIIPERKTEDGLLIKSYGLVWQELARRLSADWSIALQLKPDQWEEMLAGAFKKAGYDEVTLTPRSRDYGRDVIAIKGGVGCVKIIGSVKAYKPGHLVGYDDVRALLGVMSSELDVSKGIVATTSDFPLLIEKDRFIAPFLPTRLELLNGERLQGWLAQLAGK